MGVLLKLGVLFNNTLDLSDAIIILTDDYMNGYIEYIEFVHYLNEFEKNNNDLLYTNHRLNDEVVGLIGNKRYELVTEALSWHLRQKSKEVCRVLWKI